MIPTSILLLAAALVACGSDDYLEREAGGKLLARLVKSNPAVYGPPISTAAHVHPSAEVRARCSRHTAPYRVWLADNYSPPCSRFPCLDWLSESVGMVDDWHHWYGIATRETGTIAGNCSPEWRNYRRATELYVREMIRSGAWSYADADAAVRKGWAAELELFMVRYPEHVAAVEGWSRPAR